MARVMARTPAVRAVDGGRLVVADSRPGVDPELQAALRAAVVLLGRDRRARPEEEDRARLALDDPDLDHRLAPGEAGLGVRGHPAERLDKFADGHTLAPAPARLGREHTLAPVRLPLVVQVCGQRHPIVARDQQAQGPLLDARPEEAHGAVAQGRVEAALEDAAE